MKNHKYFRAVFLSFAIACCAQAQTGSAVLAAVSGGPPSASRAADEETLRQLNEKLLTAHDKGDVKTLDRIENDDFTLAGDFGTVTKQQQLDHVRQVGGQTEPVNRQITPQQFRFYGDVALINETDHAAGSGGKSEYQTTSVWVRSGDTWRIVQMHYSKLAEN
jgi:ketosteroid isomerase-like protein